jgi:hypothetical protein
MEHNCVQGDDNRKVSPDKDSHYLSDSSAANDSNPINASHDDDGDDVSSVNMINGSSVDLSINNNAYHDDEEQSYNGTHDINHFPHDHQHDEDGGTQTSDQSGNAYNKGGITILDKTMSEQNEDHEYHDLDILQPLDVFDGEALLLEIQNYQTNAHAEFDSMSSFQNYHYAKASSNFVNIFSNICIY